MKLENRVALVTGSNRGIGRGIALEMARAGADVVVNYLHHVDEAEAVADEVKRLGRRAVVCYGDVSQRDDVDQMVAKAEESLGPVDICVNNAALSIRKPFLELSNEEMQQVLNVSLIGAFAVSQACARRMVAHGKRGSIIMISSVHAVIPYATSVAYDSAKAALNHMCHTIAEELLPYRIRVNTIEPGWIDTPGERAFATEQDLQAEAKKLPWGRLGTSEEIGKAAVYLASDDADYITAATLRIDGGFWLPNAAGAGAVES